MNLITHQPSDLTGSKPVLVLTKSNIADKVHNTGTGGLEQALSDFVLSHSKLRRHFQRKHKPLLLTLKVELFFRLFMTLLSGYLIFSLPLSEHSIVLYLFFPVWLFAFCYKAEKFFVIKRAQKIMKANPPTPEEALQAKITVSAAAAWINMQNPCKKAVSSVGLLRKWLDNPSKKTLPNVSDGKTVYSLTFGQVFRLAEIHGSRIEKQWHCIVQAELSPLSLPIKTLCDLYRALLSDFARYGAKMPQKEYRVCIPQAPDTDDVAEYAAYYSALKEEVRRCRKTFYGFDLPETL